MLKDSGVCQITIVFRSPAISRVLGPSHQRKRPIFARAPPQRKKHLCLFRLCELHISHLAILLQPIYQVKSKAISFEWGIEQEGALQQVKVQAALLLEPYDFCRLGFYRYWGGGRRSYTEFVESLEGES